MVLHLKGLVLFHLFAFLTHHMSMPTGKVVKDEKDEPIIIQKLVARLCPREIHLELLKPPEEGGLDGARNSDGKVLISETSMRRRWPNWIVQMATRLVPQLVVRAST